MTTSSEILKLLNLGYEVYTGWFFNNFTDTGSIGHREYVTYAKKDGKVFEAQSLLN